MPITSEDLARARYGLLAPDYSGMTHTPFDGSNAVGGINDAVWQYLQDVAAGRIAEQGMRRYGDAVRGALAGDHGLLGDVLGDAMGGGLLTVGKKALTAYPRVIRPVTKVDPRSGKKFKSKALSAEAKKVDRVRKDAIKDINAGIAPEFFPVADRYYADPGRYEAGFDTATLIPKKAETQQKWRDQYDTPETRATLTEAYQQGSKDPLAADWYAMGQLENEFIKEFGEEEGRRLYKERFADAMAATTGGADPTANLLMSHYGNTLKSAGQPIPAHAYEFPYPIGGRYASTNMSNFGKNIMGDNPGITPETNPKRYNFSRNFLGDMDRATIDEQMMGAFAGPENAPTWYGSAEQVVRDVAGDLGVPAGNAQDVMWAGLKAKKMGKDQVGKPMISHVNDMLYRTSKVTGETMDQVLKRYLHGEGAMYGLLGAAVPVSLLMSEDDGI